MDSSLSESLETASLAKTMEDDPVLSDSSATTVTNEKRASKKPSVRSSGADGRSTRERARTSQRRPKVPKIRRETPRSPPKPPPSLLDRIRRFFMSFLDTNRKLTPLQLPLLIVELILLPIVLQLGLLVVGVLGVLGLLLLPVFLLLRTTDFKETLSGA
ncbi:hypothetical protein CJU89_0602 [Yarrowia sp. B02]|nr:hypothetical protein CJU89_0602 [Yarrowia sp. B02]